MIVVLVLAFGAMWLMTSRTRKQQRKAGDFRANLAVGQEVMTGSGLFGTIVAIDDESVTLESTPGNESRWIRAAVSKLVEPPVVADDEADEVDEADEADDDEADDDLGADESEFDESEFDESEFDESEFDDDELDEDETTVVPDDVSSLETRKDDDPDKKK
jgi:preprotein translocase subunit YajC